VGEKNVKERGSSVGNKSLTLKERNVFTTMIGGKDFRNSRSSHTSARKKGRIINMKTPGKEGGSERGKYRVVKVG